MNRVSRRSLLAAAITSGLIIPAHSASGKLAQRNPDAEAIECMLNNDTECAVSVWEREFESQRHDDTVRQSYFFSLVIHAVSLLNLGKLKEATQAYDTAKSILPNSDLGAFKYLGDATSSFDINLSWNDMESPLTQNPIITDDREDSYPQWTSLTGGDTTVHSITSKRPGWINYIYINTKADPRIALKVDFVPLTAVGSVVCYLGELKDRSSLFLDIQIINNSRAYWSVFASSESTYEVIHQGWEIPTEVEAWHMAEVRMKPGTVEIWIDFTYVATISISDLNYRNVGYGTSLDASASSRTFSALFDNVTLYSLE